MLKDISLFICCLTFVCSAQDYYRWKDENEVMHYSDKPPMQAYQVETFHLPPAHNIQDTSSSNNLNVKKAQPEKASKIAIFKPLNKETIRNAQGNIFVELKIDHPLDEKQHIRLVLNGKKSKTQKKTSIKLENIDRGAHRLQALLMENNKVLSSSKEITLFLHRARKAMPN